MTIPELKIKVYNDTDEFQNIVIFQPEDELGLMFNNDHLFPVAWQVFPLPAREEGVKKYGTTVYSSTEEIGVTYNVEDEDSDFLENSSFFFEATNVKIIQKKNKLIIKREAVNGDNLKYYIDNKGGQHIEKLPVNNTDKSISCQNDSYSLVSIDVYKNNSKIAIWREVANGDKAIFKFFQKIYFMYDVSIKQSQIIKKEIIDSKNKDQITKFDLTTGYSLLEVRLIYDPDEGGKKKKWLINAR